MITKAEGYACLQVNPDTPPMVVLESDLERIMCAIQAYLMDKDTEYIKEQEASHDLLP